MWTPQREHADGSSVGSRCAVPSVTTVLVKGESHHEGDHRESSSGGGLEEAGSDRIGATAGSTVPW
ncbi:hypothetical protein [Haloarcula argentinensis]|uniref:Uncharacterized protein n=1 Tax=Haloarcula argentinensis TaxID=43776 RepID=A0A847UK64_HALAR|nr:hypothetical protein [Haloarcula argentinensis]NLV11871.1 hypothetical protein [Haloarcula argentinensis]